MTRLTIMCGLPGAGKSTWVEQHREANELVMSADVIRKHPRRRMPNQILGMQLMTPDHLRRGISVIIDACATNPADRHEWKHIARCGHATTRLVIVQTPEAVCIQRQASRGANGVPTLNIRKQSLMLEHSIPLIDLEGWDEVVWVDGATC